ncbi:ABC transporter permease [Falsihalocynthiibacter arcticus]|uniref:ABC transporter permease n=1 Tax=Falsihalocynthiibacter arcticus TaxID=1579316 RepID=A0A126V0L8_9RHOB|nr:ABC transporter permease [Falsihalocynthiibacter arcticus]AML51853.1 ABC transporter permease [Falsihalocynthiibacter arcticus]
MSTLSTATADLTRSFSRNKLSWVGGILFVTLCLLAIFAPIIAPYGPIDQSIMNRKLPPSMEHLFGTDTFGRDMFSRALYGARISLTVGVVSVFFGMTIGSVLGVLAGYYGRWVDALVMRSMDVLLSFPTLITGIVIVALLGPSLTNVIIAITFTLIPKFARIARAPTLAVKERAYIEACRAMGFSDLRIIVCHIIPNILTEVLVMASLWTANAIMIEAGFAFLGLGVRPPTPTWGGMIREGFEQIFQAPWMSIFPGLCILLAVLSLNLIGDGLRDALDPRLKQMKDME